MPVIFFSSGKRYELIYCSIISPIVMSRPSFLNCIPGHLAANIAMYAAPSTPNAQVVVPAKQVIELVETALPAVETVAESTTALNMFNAEYFEHQLTLQCGLQIHAKKSNGKCYLVNVRTNECISMKMSVAN